MVKTSTGDRWAFSGQKKLQSVVPIPTARLAINKQILKFDIMHQVYMNDGAEYEIELYNPTNQEYLAKIKLDGKYISNAGIVLRPGERIWLERYLDDNRKFLFSTYKVNNTEQNKKAIQENGNVEVEFYKEYIWHYDPPVYIPYVPYVPTYPNNWGIYYTTGGGTQCGNAFTTTDVNYNVNMNEYNDGHESICYDSRSSENIECYTFTNTIETGRSEKGNISNQKFEYVDKSFETFYSTIVTYKILPISQKVYTSQETQLAYCSNCGRRIRKGENFCPKCGHKN